MTECKLSWHDYRYFPYERDLALRELRLLSGREPVQEKDGLALEAIPSIKQLRKLTYFKGIRLGNKNIVPDQALLEASSLVNGQTWSPGNDHFPRLRRQSTRYSAHGLHEYRGKFNPQIVRSIGNLISLEDRSWVFDPFGGSGTTLLESAHLGWNCLSMDLNPLGVLIANAKIRAFCADIKVLGQTTVRLVDALSKIRYSYSSSDSWNRFLPSIDYLAKWFAAPVLEQISIVLQQIQKIVPCGLRTIYKVILSDICRDVSLQDPGDLRIRRRKNAEESYPVIDLFIKGVELKIATVLNAREFVSPKPRVLQAIVGDCRAWSTDVHSILKKHNRRFFDSAITSPPYAMALPYIDTQRLSLCVLGLCTASDLKRREEELIGSREINDANRRSLEEGLAHNKAALPASVLAFCHELLYLANDPSHGFRRRNVPALVYQYFREMARMFESVRSTVRPGGHYALVLGNNRTTLRGKTLVIDTPTHLAAIAESRGWEILELIRLDTYARFDIHRENSIQEERLLILRNRGQS